MKIKVWPVELDESQAVEVDDDDGCWACTAVHETDCADTGEGIAVTNGTETRRVTCIDRFLHLYMCEELPSGSRDLPGHCG